LAFLACPGGVLFVVVVVEVLLVLTVVVCEAQLNKETEKTISKIPVNVFSFMLFL